MFHAFGSPPPFTVIWMAYFVGMLGNLLPLPGGLGGVEGGMIGAFAAFGVDFNLAVLAVLVLPRDLLLAADAPRRGRLLPAAPHGRALARASSRQPAPAERPRARRIGAGGSAAGLVMPRDQRLTCYTLQSKVTRDRVQARAREWS